MADVVTAPLVPLSLGAMVQRAYPSPEWAVFFEVGNGTGWGASRHADAVALGIWPSRGHTIVGFEFKTDRRDWLREKKNPAKAEAVASHCDAWYLVTTDDAIAPLEEIPAPWGLLVANKDRSKLLTRKPCAPFEDRDKSVMARRFVAAMLRKVPETTVPKAELARLVAEAVEAERRQSRDGAEQRHLEMRVKKLEEVITTFKRVTGVDLYGWRGTASIAAAVHAVLDGDVHKRGLVDAKRRLEQGVKTLEEAIAEWPDMEEVPRG